MSHENLSVAIMTSDKEFGRDLNKHLEERGWLPGPLDTVDELKGYLDDKYLDVVILDEPDDALWAMCVEAQNASEAQSPKLCVLVAKDEPTQTFRDAGADMVVPKPASLVDVEDRLLAFFG